MAKRKKFIGCEKLIGIAEDHFQSVEISGITPDALNPFHRGRIDIAPPAMSSPFSTAVWRKADSCREQTRLWPDSVRDNRC
jgi:hypothetical protein